MRFFWFILLGAIFFNSCTFQPEGNNFVEVQPVTSGLFYIDLTNHGDTIRIGATGEVTYQLDVGNKNAQLVTIIINGEEYLDLTPPNFTFNLFGANYGTGYHLIEFMIYSNTGSGSLADRAGMEHLVGSAFFVLYVDIDPAHKIAITDFVNDDGRLKVIWEKYDRPNFIKCVLYKKTTIHSPAQLVAIVEDQDINYAYDENYIGGEEKYWVEVHAVSSSLFPTVGYDSTASLGASRIISVSKDDASGGVEAIWDMNKFHRAFYSYRIKAISDEIRSYYPPLNFITDISTNSTVFIEFPFGGPLQIVLEVSSKSFNRTYDTLSYTLGEMSLPFHFLDYHPELNTFYRVVDDTLHMFGDGVSEHKTILPDLENTVFDQSFVRKNNLYLLHGTKLYLYSTSNLEFRKTIDLQNIVGPYNSTQYPSITENGIMLFQKIERKPPYTYRSLCLVNLETGAVLLTRDSYNLFPGSSISLDGKFLFESNTIYEWDGNEYVVFNANPQLGGHVTAGKWLGSVITGNYQILSLFSNSSNNQYDCIKYDIQSDIIQDIVSYTGASAYFEFDMLNDVLYSQSISEYGNPTLLLLKDSGQPSLDIFSVANLDYRAYKYLSDTLYSSTGYKLFLEP